MLQWIVIYFLVFVAARFTLTKIVSSFSECEGLFYKHTEPQGFSTQNTVKICQRFYGYYRFATLYSTEYRIPVYNAFQLTYPSFESTWNEMFSDLEDSNKEFMFPIYSKQENGMVEPQTLYELKDSKHETQHYNNVRGIPFHFYGLTLTIPVTESLKEKWYFKTQRHIKDRIEKQSKGNRVFLVTGPILQKYDSRSNDITAVKQIWIAGCFSDFDGYDSTFAYMVKATGSIEEVTLSDLQNMLGGDTMIFMDNCSNSTDKHVIYFDTFCLEIGLWVVTSLLPHDIFITIAAVLLLCASKGNLVLSIIQMPENVIVLIIVAGKVIKFKALYHTFVSYHIFIITAFMALQSDIITFSNLVVLGAVSVSINLFMLVGSGKVNKWNAFITAMVDFTPFVILSIGSGYVLSCLSILLCIYIVLFFLTGALIEEACIWLLAISLFFLNIIICKLFVYTIASNYPFKHGAAAILVVLILFVFAIVCEIVNSLLWCLENCITVLI
ncbi:endonuclease domain-containing 1 protein-like [Protopterus annectens]|uniref:endonuclease domain-containing 1 protein-like n=1 Tax=Protopterus annectens TaxID=7888 RepID=UPI001CFA55B4|nr:endonuclease domain-containing 1 protein-like [Protopterus annectens]